MNAFTRPVAIAALVVVGFLNAVCAAEPQPEPDGTKAATAAMAAFRMPRGFTVELFATEPKLVNPVAICLDE